MKQKLLSFFLVLLCAGASAQLDYASEHRYFFYEQLQKPAKGSVDYTSKLVNMNARYAAKDDSIKALVNVNRAKQDQCIEFNKNEEAKIQTQNARSMYNMEQVYLELNNSMMQLEKLKEEEAVLENDRNELAVEKATQYVEFVKANSENALPTYEFSSGIDIDNVYMNITNYAIERSKMDLDVVYFKRFKKMLNTNPEASTLLPSTAHQLNIMQRNDFEAFLPKLRMAFFDDLKQYHAHLNMILTLPRYRELIATSPELAVALKSLNTVNKLKSKGTQLSQVINQLSGFEEFNYFYRADLHNYGATWKVINIFSEAFLNPVSNAYYSRKEIQSIIDDKIKSRLIIDQILKRIKDENILFLLRKSNMYSSGEDTLANLIGPLSTARLMEFRTMLQNIANAVDDFERVKHKIQGDTLVQYPTPQHKIDMWEQYLNAADHCVDAMSGLFTQLPGIKASNYLGMSHNLMRIPRDAVGQNYTALTYEGLSYLGSCLKLAEQTRHDDSVVLGYKALSTTLRYANFASSVVEAKSSDEVKLAIQAAALTPGNSAIKKHADFNISLQMHVGPAIALNSKKIINAPAASWRSKLSITIPVGLSFNYGLQRWGSLGFFTSLLDLGAFAQYRVKNDRSIAESFRFLNIFSPSTQLSYGFGANIPLSLNFGCQYGPGLGKVMEKNVVVQSPSWRWLLSLTLDIPAYTILNVPKNRSHLKLF